MKNRLDRWAVILIPAVVLVLVAARQQQQPTRVAWVNTAAIVQETPGYAEADSIFRAEMEGYQSEVQRLQQQLDSAISAYDQQAIVLSPSAREEKQRELQDTQTQMQRRIQELQLRSQQRERELMAPLEERVQSVIEGIRAERNIAIIFDVASSSTIVAADRTLDLTATVVQRLRASAQQ